MTSMNTTILFREDDDTSKAIGFTSGPTFAALTFGHYPASVNIVTSNREQLELLLTAALDSIRNDRLNGE